MLTHDMFTNPFKTPAALRINARRLEHLASLNLPTTYKDTVLEVGAGIGMLSTYWLDRGHYVTLTDVRKCNLAKLLKLAKFYPGSGWVEQYNVELEMHRKHHDIVFCYGVLYHCMNTNKVIEHLALATRRFLLLETMVTTHGETVDESTKSPDQSCRVYAYRPTREGVHTILKEWFPYVYTPITQPAHPEFPTSWPSTQKNQRAIFIASKEEVLTNPLLTLTLPTKQTS